MPFEHLRIPQTLFKTVPLHPEQLALRAEMGPHEPIGGAEHLAPCLFSEFPTAWWKVEFTS